MLNVIDHRGSTNKIFALKFENGNYIDISCSLLTLLFIFIFIYTIGSFEMILYKGFFITSKSSWGWAMPSSELRMALIGLMVQLK